MPKSSHHCHKLIKQTAMDMAHELYDTLMQDNDWWTCWRASHPGASRKALELIFVRRSWPGLVPDARATLARLLAQPISPVLKDEIYDALLLDNTLPQGKVASTGVGA